jgi:microcystin-dependent protein
MATLSKGQTFGATETITNTKLHNLVDLASITNIVNADLNALAAIVDTKLAQITTASKVSGTAITGLASLPSGAGVIPDANLPATTSPVAVGAVMIWTTATAPTGYLLCNGAAVSRTTYSDLFGVIGEIYGIGDGSLTFNVPNLKGSVPVGLDASQTEFDTLAEADGHKTHALSIAELAAHTHSYSVSDNVAGAGGGGGPRANNVAGTTGSTGSGTAHNNLQPYLVMNYIIKT